MDAVPGIPPSGKVTVNLYDLVALALVTPQSIPGMDPIVPKYLVTGLAGTVVSSILTMG